MIVDEYVEINWASGNKNHFIEKGYVFTKLKDSLIVKIEDLSENAKTKARAKCISCGNIELKPYKSIIYSLKYTHKKSFHCTKCRGIGRIAELEAKQKLGLLNPGDNGYWTYKENREKSLIEFINKHGTIDNMARIYPALHDAFQQKDSRTMYEVVTELGYNFKELSSMMPNGFYRDFNRVKEEIDNFIKEYNRFPEVNEVRKTLRISQDAIAFHGGMEGLRQKMGYDKEILIDDSGYKNRSIFEFKVAQFLIHNGIFAKRDATIFKGERYTCDFVIESKDGEKFYVECWGYSMRDNHPLSEEYTRKKNIKLDLYKSNNMKLISIDLIDTQNMSHEKFQIYLKEKFKDIIDKDLIIFKNTEFMDINTVTNDEILEAVMKYSEHEDYLPTVNMLRDKSGYQYELLIRERFGGFIKMAEYFGKKTGYRKEVS